MTTDTITTESLAARLLAEAAEDYDASRLLELLDERARWLIQEALDRLQPETSSLIVQAVQSLAEQDVTVEELVMILRGRTTSSVLSQSERAALVSLVQTFRDMQTIV